MSPLPLRGSPVGHSFPRVTLRFTRGYNPAPLGAQEVDVRSTDTPTTPEGAIRLTVGCAIIRGYRHAWSRLFASFPRTQRREPWVSKDRPSWV